MIKIIFIASLLLLILNFTLYISHYVRNGFDKKRWKWALWLNLGLMALGILGLLFVGGKK